MDRTGVDCPHCGKEMVLEPYVAHNAINYNNAVLARAECCGQPVRVEPLRKIRVTAYKTVRKTDDWGKEFSK